MGSFNVSRTHQAFTHEFSWSHEADELPGRTSPNELTCCVYDSLNQNLYIGQSKGHICQLNVLELGTHSPRLLGKHKGHVKAVCIYPFAGVRSRGTLNLVASCSADSTIKIWSHDPKTLHSTKPCLQTLYGHTAAVTCIAAVHQYLVSGGADGSVLLWRPADTGLLAVPQFQVAAKLWTSDHWVLSLSCQQQPSDAGAGQGVFVAVANQPLLRLQFDKRAMQTATNSQVQVQAFAGPNGSSAPASSRAQQQQVQQEPFQQSTATLSTTESPSPSNSSPEGSEGSDGLHTNDFPSLNLPTKNSSTMNTYKSNTGRPRSTRQSAGDLSLPTQDLSVFAVLYVPHELAVLTLAYDGCCRLHSAVDGGLRCKWHSPGRSKFVAVECTGIPGEVLLGDDRGALHICSLHSEKLLAIKQVTQSRITAILCCGTTSTSKPSSAQIAPSAVGSSNQSSSVTQFVVLSAEGMGLWQLLRGISHDILPGGHKQAVIAVQICQATVQIDLSSLQLPAAQQQPASSAAQASPGAVSGGSTYITASGNSDGLSSNASSLNRGLFTLISAGLDNRVLQWDLTSGPSVLNSLSVDSEGSELSAMTFLQNWAILATGHEDGQIRLWNLDTGSHTLLVPTNHTNTVCCLAPALTARGDELLLSGDYDGLVVLWEPQHVKGAQPHMIASFQAFGLSLDELLEAHQLAKLSSSPESSRTNSAQRSRIQSARRRKAITASMAGAAPQSGIACSTAGSIATAPTSSMGALGTQRLADIGRLTNLSSTGAVLQKSLSGHGLTGALQAAAGLSTAGTGPQLQQQGIQQPGLLAGQYRLSRSPMSSPTASIGCRWAGVAKQEPWLGHLQLQQQQQTSTAGDYGFLQSGRYSPVAPSPTAAAAAALQAALGGKADVEASEVLVVLFCSVQQVVVTAGNTGAIRVWSGTCTGELLGQHLGHTGPVSCLTLDGNFLFSGSSDMSIRMWDLLPPSFASRGCNTLGSSQDGISRMLGSPAEVTIAAASSTTAGKGGAAGSDWQQCLQQIGTGSPLSKGRESPAAQANHANGGRYSANGVGVPGSTAFQVLQGHTAAVTGLSMVHGTGILVSCGRDARLLQWDYTTGQLLMQQQLNGMEFVCLAVQQDCKQAYVGTSKGQVLAFRVAAEVAGDNDASISDSCEIR